MRLTALAAVVATAVAQQGPCDIYAAAGTPCVAAHSVTRALFGAYAGPLYQVKRSDNATLDIGVLAPGGVANAAAQDAFCGSAACGIFRIYDQVRLFVNCPTTHRWLRGSVLVRKSAREWRRSGDARAARRHRLLLRRHWQLAL